MTPVIAVTDTAVGDDSLERRLAEETGADYRLADELGEALDGANVVFTNFAPLGGDELGRLADGAVMLAMMLVRRVREFDDALHRGEEVDADAFGPIPSLETRTVGLVGAGRIGARSAARFQIFGCRTIAYDPFVDADALAAQDIELVPWRRLLADSDIVSLHAPLTDDTHHLVDDDSFAAMRRGVHVVNTARGGLIDSDGLVRALDAGIVSGAALDVTDPEPLPLDAPLRSRSEVILTPHVAFYSTESLERLQRLAVDEGRRALAGEPLRSRVLPTEGDA